MFAGLAYQPSAGFFGSTSLLALYYDLVPVADPSLIFH
jgi:hypothetical protein